MLERARFVLEGIDGTYEGWHDPKDRWNGFANPLFGKDESARLVAAFDARGTDQQNYLVVFDSEADVFNVSVIEGDEVIEVGIAPATDADGVGHCYDWGHGWCWLEEDYWSA